MSGLQRLRDLWIESARSLIDDFVAATPPQELGGILGRAGAVLDALSAHLDAFAEVEFAGPDREPEEVEHLLLAVGRIPRSVLAFATELERSEEDRAWAFLIERATQLGSALSGLHHAWLLEELGVDISASLPPPELRSLARLGRAAKLGHLAALFGADETGEPPPIAKESPDDTEELDELA